MPHFRYRAVAQGGEIVVGEVEAPSSAEVVRRIKYLGHLPIDTELITPNALTRAGGVGGKLPKARDVTIFLRQLAMLIGAGVTLEAALQTLGTHTSKPLASFAGAIRAAISSGDSFAEALERQSAVIAPAYVAMVRAGEASGRLEPVLRAIVEDRTRRELLADRLNSAIRYPLFLVLTAVAVLTFLLLFVVPQFEPVFKDLGGRLNAGAAVVLCASAALRANLDLVIGISVLALLGGLLVASRREWRTRIVAALLSLPGLAAIASDRRTARITATLGLLVENGVALPAALKILRDVVSGPRYVAAVDRVYDQVRSGRRFGDALDESDLVPPLAVRMLKVGDETGDLPSIARHAAQFYEYRLGVGLDRLMGAIGPVTIILVSLIIGALIISIMSALLSLTEAAL